MFNRIINFEMRIGITTGDISGIGIELIIRTFRCEQMLSKCTAVVFGDIDIVNRYKNKLCVDVETKVIRDIDQVEANKLNVLCIQGNADGIRIGQPCKQSGQYAFKSLQKATENLQKGEVDILVTCPIDKHNIQSKEFNFQGHTEYMEDRLKGKSLMFLVGKKLRVGVVTGHVPISKVANLVTRELISEKLYLMEQSLRRDFCIANPKIALLSINPHCGDKGIIGSEDDLITIPLLQEFQNRGKLFFGPFSADSFFGSGLYKRYDATLAIYHDQGLIPFKTLCFNSGVNFTAGLDKIRVSPDHGTAFDIAGKGRANYNSFKEAILAGIEIFENRRKYKLQKNRL